MSPKRNKQKSENSKLNSSTKTKKIKQNSNSSKENNPICDLLNKKWNVFRVSLIYNFSKEKLKFYGKKLNEFMNTKMRGIPDFSYRSTFTFYSNFKLNNEQFNILQVKIIKDESQCVYSGFFISSNAAKTNNEESLSLPVLLAEGKSHEICRAHSYLCKMFDCDIQTVGLSLHGLITFFVKILVAQRETSNISSEQIILEYKIPSCEPKDKIKICLFLEPTLFVWGVMIKTLGEKFQDAPNQEIVWDFYNKILNHIFRAFNMDLGSADLNRIVFSDAFLSSDGQVKFKTQDTAISSLKVLECFTPLDAVTQI